MHKAPRACTETDRFAVHAAGLPRGSRQRERHTRQPSREQEHQTLAIDGHRAVRVRGKLVYPTGSSIDTPTFYLAISTYIANEKHMVSLEASAPVDVDESVIQEIIKIEESVKFDKGG